MKKPNISFIILCISCSILILTSITTYNTQNIIMDIIFSINAVISLTICIYLIIDNHKKLRKSE